MEGWSRADVRWRMPALLLMPPVAATSQLVRVVQERA